MRKGYFERTGGRVAIVVAGLASCVGGCSQYVPIQDETGNYRIEEQPDPDATLAAAADFVIGGWIGDAISGGLRANSRRKQAEATGQLIESLQNRIAKLEKMIQIQNDPTYYARLRAEWEKGNFHGHDTYENLPDYDGDGEIDLPREIGGFKAYVPKDR